MIDEASAFAKRVKRQVSGKERECFAVTALGLEKPAENELSSLSLSHPSTTTEPGGITFKGNLADLMSANLHLRIANRILMRLTTFKAEGLFELQRKLADIAWELFLFQDQKVKINVTSHHSRLYHSNAVAERVDQSIAKRQAVMLPGSQALPDQQLFVRIQNNRLTFSLDSSGEPLYKRGIKSHGGTAPLRETLAAAVLKIAGYNPAAPLIDPMCGTGSFCLEAAMAAKNMAAGLNRSFAFAGWPAFNPKRWEYLKKNAREAILTLTDPIIFASDRSHDTTNTLLDCLKRHNLEDAIRVQTKDFFDLSPMEWHGRKGLVALNPPYGVRLSQAGNPSVFLSELVHKLKKDYKGWKVALLVPQDAVKSLRPLALKSFRLIHGGLNIILSYGKIY